MISLLSLVLLAAALLFPARAQSQTTYPLTDILLDFRSTGKTFADVKLKAAALAPGDWVRKPSNTANQDLRFSGTFVAGSNYDRLAIFSDDGCDIYITHGRNAPIRVHSRFHVGQHLPDLSQSLYPISYRFQSGQTYTIDVFYSNVWYGGTTDLDGLTLFAYVDPAPPTPTPTATVTPTATPAPTPLLLNSDNRTWSGARVFWQTYDGAGFQSYSLHRSPSPTFAPADANDSNRVGGLINNLDQTDFQDTGLAPNTHYYYLLRVLHGNGAYDTPYTRHDFTTPAQPLPVVSFEGLPRACAGHVLDAAHTFTVTAKAQRLAADGTTLTPMANTQFRFIFENNVTTGKAAQFWPLYEQDPTQTPVAIFPYSSDAQGQIKVRVLSSDKIGKNIKVKAQWRADASSDWQDVGDITCDFARVSSKRAFGIVDLDQSYFEDNGWQMSPRPYLLSAGETLTATLCLKFRRDLTVAEDTRYFLRNGVAVISADTNGDGYLSAAESLASSPHSFNATVAAAKLSDGDNWIPVSGHDTKIGIESLTDRNGNKLPISSEYLYFVNAAGQIIGADGQPLLDKQQLPGIALVPDFVLVPASDGQGRAVVYLKAGPQINRVMQIILKAKDLTQK